jgi:hypothetical protein
VTISKFLRRCRLRAGLLSYNAVFDRAKQLGYTTTVQFLNQSERVDAHMTGKSRDMFIECYKLEQRDIDTLDLLSAQCLVGRGSNTNPHLRVVDTRQYEEATTRAASLAVNYMRASVELNDAEAHVIETALKGILATCLTPKTT